MSPHLYIGSIYPNTFPYTYRFTHSFPHFHIVKIFVFRPKGCNAVKAGHRWNWLSKIAKEPNGQRVVRRSVQCVCHINEQIRAIAKIQRISTASKSKSWKAAAANPCPLLHRRQRSIMGPRKLYFYDRVTHLWALFTSPTPFPLIPSRQVCWALCPFCWTNPIWRMWPFRPRDANWGPIVWYWVPAAAFLWTSSGL